MTSRERAIALLSDLSRMAGGKTKPLDIVEAHVRLAQVEALKEMERYGETIPVGNEREEKAAG